MYNQNLSYVRVQNDTPLDTVPRARVVCTCGWQSGTFEVGPFDPNEALVVYSVEHLKCKDPPMVKRDLRLDLLGHIKTRMGKLGSHPSMWAFTKEAFVVQVVMLLEMYNLADPQVEDPSKDFFIKIFGIPGSNICSGLRDEPDTVWCTKVLIEAKKLMPGMYY